MAKVYNIMDKLVNDKPILEIDEDHKYKINNSKNNAIYIQSLVKQNKNKKSKNKDEEINEIEMLEKIIKASLGVEAFEYIESLELSFECYNTIINAIMAAISNLELEEIEEISKKEVERFQQEEK
ncbi:hypothetical protein K5V21_13755 [Clostridium sardiniense]|uniref:Phage portal protein n=1 Tax=Clostridium sardiniense TaxID=29369 RepID=A0ABS7L0C4_CLOSR|nr:hypothetical protein [Clostridium sardiniense]MBY0756510.1 hypothetical protein [Clostridium sardiniense]MDQ0460257.1 CRISPR/Cas system-associated endonuclease Cas3-HD [Clostridium sardiniense]